MYEFLMNSVKEIKYVPLYSHSEESDFDLLPNNYKSCSAGRETAPRGCSTWIKFPSIRPSRRVAQDGDRRDCVGGKEEEREKGREGFLGEEEPSRIVIMMDLWGVRHERQSTH